MQFIETYNLTGIIIGLGTFLIIGIFHPLVIKGEYYFGVKCWWAFLVLGIIALIASLAIHNTIISILCGVTSFSSFWGIGEIFEQKTRVEKGWFPKRTNKKEKQRTKNHEK
ncbi:lipopolysaccharide export LptBFGC system permease protein LptF [Dysgonomonadaceae bacterium PH5-43]|nr:lipopolysaccharide export LptBFGC system permease protein LptF [Dysgonomonadaceae bacterium PH5-43]